MSPGRTLMVLGVVLFAAGALVWLGEKSPLRLGHLPGDIVIRGKSGVFYFPLATCILLSIVASCVLWFVNRR